jgi:hypothetical protein
MRSDSVAARVIGAARGHRDLRDSTPLLDRRDALAAQAEADGCLLLRGVPGADAVAPVRTLVHEACVALGLLDADVPERTAPRARAGVELAGTGYDDPRWLALQQRVLADPRFVRLGDERRLLRVLAVLLGEEPRGRRGDICRIALPRAAHLTTPPHQDHWYTGGTTKMWTAWIALTDTPLELGPLAVLPGSHRRGLLPHRGAGAGRQRVRAPAHAFAAAPLAAGDAILFYSLTVHRALPNVTANRVRLSVDYRYQAASEPLHAVRRDGTRAWG